ncbi:hypothetical protein N8612_07845, partial [Verrucomicrobia bacterium]|nr:hypothetical protein [Verrucomicrobiota bacterium]
MTGAMEQNLGEQITRHTNFPTLQNNDSRDSKSGYIPVFTPLPKFPVELWVPLRRYTQELLKLYGRRWESEIYYKELKIDMRGGDLLQSHTPLTAAQEIAAWILAHAVLMDTRIKAAQCGGVEVLRISFLKTLNWVQGLWQFLELGSDLMEPKQVDKLVKRVIKEISQSITPKRRQRSSPRALRQPVVSWPRLTENSYQLGPT